MHLAVVSAFPPRLTGLGQYGWHITSGLAAQGGFDSITVLADRSDETTDDVDGALTVRRVWQRDEATSIGNVWRALLATKPDVLWFNTGMAMFGRSRHVNFIGLMTPLIARRAGIPVVTTLHEVFETVHARDLGMQNGRITTLGARLATRLLLTSNVVCVTLRHYAHLLRQRYGVANIEHLPHGTFTEVEPLPRTRAAAAPNVLFFAHHAPHRGLEVLIEAFRIVQARFPGVTLTIAGSDHARFPGYLARVRASVNGQPGLIWLGPQPEAQVRALFAEASVVVLPYLTTTGSSSVLYRAAAYGRPVIASDLDDLRLATSEANLRVTFAPVGKAHALGQAIVRLLADPQQQCAETQHNLNALRALTLSATCARYETLLREAAHAAR